MKYYLIKFNFLLQSLKASTFVVNTSCLQLAV